MATKKAKKKAAPQNQDAALQEVLKELQTIRALLLLMLLKIGGTTEEIGASLGLTGARVRQMIPASKIKKLNFSRDAADS